MILSEQEVQSLTGYVRPSAQIRWLQHNGWRFTVNALGKPSIAVAEFQRRMIGGSSSTTRQQQEPDWSAISGT